MAHTNEPWRVGKTGGVVADAPIPEMLGSNEVEYYGGHLVCESVTKSNAARIVACVNACAGIETSLLESIHAKNLKLQTVGKVEETQAFIANTVVQRDELLAALKLAREFIVNGIEVGAIKMPDYDTPDPALLTLPAIEAAIAKVEA